MSQCTGVECCAPSPFQDAPATGPLFYNTEQSATATCPEGESGEPVTVTKAANLYTSISSQASADSQAYQAALALAEAQLTCT
jgi:hypothetical protein